MNHYPEAIEILDNANGFTDRKLLVEIAKHEPSAVVRACTRLRSAGWIEEVRPIVLDGKKINAIKECRRLTGMGLKEAKEAVEQAFNI